MSECSRGGLCGLGSDGGALDELLLDLGDPACDSRG